MLMTRLFAKDFVITKSRDNIDAVMERAERTIRMIAEARELAINPGYLLIIESLDQELEEYLSHFEKVTTYQEERDEIVHDVLNVVGPKMEQNLLEGVNRELITASCKGGSCSESMSSPSSSWMILVPPATRSPLNARKLRTISATTTTTATRV